MVHHHIITPNSPPPVFYAMIQHNHCLFSRHLTIMHATLWLNTSVESEQQRKTQVSFQFSSVKNENERNFSNRTAVKFTFACLCWYNRISEVFIKVKIHLKNWDFNKVQSNIFKILIYPSSFQLYLDKLWKPTLDNNKNLIQIVRLFNSFVIPASKWLMTFPWSSNLPPNNVISLERDRD